MRHPSDAHSPPAYEQLRDDELARAAAQTIAKGSKSFAAAAQLFEPATRQSAILLYAWCRHCDDVIDGQTLGFQREPAADEQVSAAARLSELERLTREACHGEPMTIPAFAALERVVQLHGIPSELPQEHLCGFAMDVAGHRYATIDETLLYCYRVAGVVGLMMARIMGVSDEATLDRACDLGIAFQLTNIARDIVDDAQQGRCYLPETWLEEVGLTPAQLTDPDRRPQLAILARRLVELAEPYYASARIGLAALPLRSAWAIGTALTVYRAIGLQIVARGDSAWERRAGTGKAGKLAAVNAGLAAAINSRRRRECPPRPSHLWQRPGLTTTQAWSGGQPDFRVIDA